ncbi:class II aldolase/adducin family protein [Cyanobium sp. CH-040]|uniref:class II aldolase/adducin family protein n=1 Tax=Cyanobium sp. CH-040 TaxID=2823708 RepID=UPI0020CF1A27|nr:class II aldolase/adducin family protein [Cyanobium sp. CH-040]
MTVANSPSAAAGPSAAVPCIGGVPLTPKPLQTLAPPVFETPELERRHRQERLVAALRIFGRLGFGEGVAGHITVRDPEFPDHFWVNPFARCFRRLKVSDLLLVNHAGEVVIGHWPVNRAAFVLHAALHASRPEVQAAAHAHSPHGKAFASLGRLVDPISQDSCMFFEDHVLVREDGGKVVLEEEAGRRFAAAFSRGKAAIHQNHGLFTVGHTVEEAAYWFIAMERACQCQLLAEAAGTPQLIRREWAEYTREHTATPQAGWLNFQTLWEDVIVTEPDLFD